MFNISAANDIVAPTAVRAAVIQSPSLLGRGRAFWQYSGSRDAGQGAAFHAHAALRTALEV
jgi:hypothetical protein